MDEDAPVSDQKLTLTKAIELAAAPDEHIVLVREGRGPWHLRIQGELTGARSFQGKDPIDAFRRAIAARAAVQ